MFGDAREVSNLHPKVRFQGSNSRHGWRPEAALRGLRGGNRGGARVVYYSLDEAMPVYALPACAEAEFAIVSMKTDGAKPGVHDGRPDGPKMGLCKTKSMRAWTMPSGELEVSCRPERA